MMIFITPKKNAEYHLPLRRTEQSKNNCSFKHYEMSILPLIFIKHIVA
jgi:hypothetical protein